MSKRTRWILFFIAIVGFFILSYVTVVFALGYRYDITTWSFARTGSFRVVANVGADVYINDEHEGDMSFLGNTFSKSRLLPRTYGVRVVRDGYTPWHKNIQIEEGFFVDIPNIVLLPTSLVREKVATSSFGFPLVDSRVREAKGRFLTFDDHEIIVTWTDSTSYQPFRRAGDEAVIVRMPTHIDDVQWYRDADHFFVSSGGKLIFYEIDTRGGLNNYQLTPISGPFWYDADENAVYLMENREIVRLKLD